MRPGIDPAVQVLQLAKPGRIKYFQGPRYHICLQVWVNAPGAEEEIFSVREAP